MAEGFSRPASTRGFAKALADLFIHLKFFDLGNPMFGDRLGLLLIEPGQLRSCALINAKQLVELCMQREGIAAVRPLNKQGHEPHCKRCNRVEIKCRSINRKPQRSV